MADQTDPDEIQREIERTRADLAETIDAIADKVSPKRAVARTADRVKTAVKGDSRPHGDVGVPEAGERVPVTASAPSALGSEPGTAADRHEAYARATGTPGGSHAGSLYTVQRRLRVDRVLLVAGAVVAVAVVVVLRRRGHDEDLDFDF